MIDLRKKQINTIDDIDLREYLHGKYNNAEINFYLPYVQINDWFFEGHEAEQVINDIYNIWLHDNITVEKAINDYAFINLH